MRRRKVGAAVVVMVCRVPPDIYNVPNHRLKYSWKREQANHPSYPERMLKSFRKVELR